MDLVVHRPRGARRIVTASRGPAEAMLGDRRHGPLFATASAVPIRADYASRLLTRLAEQAGVGKIKARRGRPRTAAVGR